MSALPKKRAVILVAVLDWGLGHATRCIPLIRQLLLKNHEVVIAGNGASFALLQEEFPRLKTEEIVGYDIKYPFDNMVLNMSFQVPRILWAIRKEHRQLKKLQQRYDFSGIISDNRYGCFVRGIPSVFLGHQLQILTPIDGLSTVVNFFHQKWLSLFDTVWIPDVPNGLSGKLAQNNLQSVHYIGLLSRMKYLNPPIKYQIVAVLSGVEPQRTKLENKLIDQLEKLDVPSLLVRGKLEGETGAQISPNFHVIPYLTSTALNRAMSQAAVIICRPGYSSLMDLAKLQKKAIVIPTPGQTEQEYLGDYLHRKKKVVCQLQNDFNLAIGMDEIQDTEGMKGFSSHDDLLPRAIELTFRKAENPS